MSLLDKLERVAEVIVPADLHQRIADSRRQAIGGAIIASCSPCIDADVAVTIRQQKQTETFSNELESNTNG